MRLTATRLLPKLVGGVSVFAVMKRLICILALMVGTAVPAQAQLLDKLPEIEIPDVITDLGDKIGDAIKEANKPNYSHLAPKAEREARLNDLFVKLELERDVDAANLVAEEIWAIWLSSGSASVDLLLRRATASDKRGDNKLARRLYDHVTTIKPDYAEGWSRSGRLAFEEQDYNRAVVEITQALIYEPRHFYALWTMGNLLENLNRQDEALEAYKQALDVYPAQKTVKDRVRLLEGYISGDVL